MMLDLKEYFAPVEKFNNQTIQDIARSIGMDSYQTVNKLSIVLLMKSVFKSENIDLDFLKENYNVATKIIRINERGIPKESMSFEGIKFNQLIKETWETSFIRNKFANTTFAFVVFKENSNSITFKEIKIWKMPFELLETDLKAFWLNLKSIVSRGVKIKNELRGTKKVTYNNLPGSSDSLIMHVRPKAKNAADKVRLPDGIEITKQAYWINMKFIERVIKGEFDQGAINQFIENLKLEGIAVRETNTSLTEDIKSKTLKMRTALPDRDYNQDYFDSIVDEVKNKIKYDFEECYIYTEFKNIVQKQTGQKLLKYEVENVAEKLNYKIYSNLLIHNAYLSLNDFIERKVFSKNYFELPQSAFWNSPTLKKLFYNLQKEYSLIKISKDSYLTKTAFNDKGINRGLICAFIDEVIITFQEERYFTVKSVNVNLQNHPIYRFGFEDTFFDSILTYSDKFYSTEIENKYFYSSKIAVIKFVEILEALLNDLEVDQLTVDEVAELIQEKYFVKINPDMIVRTINTRFTRLYYFAELDRIFISKSAYLDFVYSK